MHIALIAVDSTFPNLALMKIARFHRDRGDTVEWFRDINNPHQVIPQWQQDMARWAMRREFWIASDFKDFSPRIGFKCGEYF